MIREIGKAARHNMGEARVTRVLWRARNPAELDSAEELLRRQQVVGAESLCHLGGCPAASGAGLAGAGLAGSRLLRVTTLESPFRPYVAHYPLLAAERPEPELAARLAAESAAAVTAAIGPRGS